MNALDPQKCQHTTAPTFLGYSQEIVGIDLFDEQVNGENQTVIYQRFADGKRWPARTVTRKNPEHYTSVIDAWSRRGTVHDHRTN